MVREFIHNSYLFPPHIFSHTPTDIPNTQKFYKLIRKKVNNPRNMNTKKGAGNSKRAGILLAQRNVDLPHIIIEIQIKTKMIRYLNEEMRVGI